jgi:hypothetical protein
MGEGPSEARRRVEEARDQLGSTVESIVYRVNAPMRAKRRVKERFSRIVHRAPREEAGE